MTTSSVRRILLFGTVGTVGFLVDSAVLYAVMSFAGLYLGRALSFLCAVAVTWVLNRCCTFSDRQSSFTAGRELLAYLSLMLFGGLVNYSVYAWLLDASDFVRLEPVVGVAAGSLAGMGVNLLSARFLLFRVKRIAS